MVHIRSNSWCALKNNFEIKLIHIELRGLVIVMMRTICMIVFFVVVSVDINNIESNRIDLWTALVMAVTFCINCII